MGGKESVSNDGERASEMRTENDHSIQKAVASDLDKSKGREDRLRGGVYRKNRRKVT